MIEWKKDGDYLNNPLVLCTQQRHNRNSGVRMMDDEPAGVNEQRSMLS